MLRRLLLVGCLAGGLVAVGVAATPRVGPGARFGPGRADTPLARLISGNIGRLLVLRSELNLTPGQKAQIHGVLLNNRDEIVATMQAVHAKRIALGEAVLHGESEGEIRAAAAELGEEIADAGVRASRLRDQIAPVLTDEQQQLILQFLRDKDKSVEQFLEQAASGR